MRRLLAAVPLFVLVGCSYVGVGTTPMTRFGAPSSSPGPVSISVGKSDSTLETPETEKEASTAEASDSPGATQ
ncbi:hypothetical protein [Corallococcus aberystwythensis]|uniref:Uncharacterized protein n=1 Tax=Corallococcus aberystwythensis TaxID=2316722 RepID=A0A3A8PVF9_9BACT|nr:hypothetical protein [Corallococcus aberystwythensis]RKH59958.1 hypothetical protein D7W81_26405 [Corallococcus aberystwythensis]